MRLFKLIIFIIIVLNSKILFSQGNTNVDTTYLKPKWMNQNLNVITFNNGDAIYKAENLSDFSEKGGIENNPAFIIFESENGSEVLYNWKVIQDIRGIAPKGYKIPSSMDFYNFFDPKTANFRSLGYADTEELDFVDYEESQYCWTNTQTANSAYLSNAVLFNYEKTVLETSELPFDKSFGLSIRCIEDLDYSIKTKEYPYKQLLPIAYDEILNRLKSSIIDNHELKNNDEISLKAQISILRDGTNQSKVLSDLTKNAEILKNQDALKLSLNTVLENSLIPYYHGQIVQSKSEFNLGLKYNETFSNMNEFNIFKVKNVNKNALKDLERANSFGFMSSNKEEIFSLVENGILIKSEKTEYLNQFKSKGPIYSSFSILPGLGLSMITNNNYNSTKRSNFKKFLLSSSISLGVISIGSKIVSKIYYKRYTYDLLGTTAATNYKTANTFQKVFLTTGFGYCVLGAIDFTWTFSIGCKNKVTQLRLNKQIKDNPAHFILK